MINLQLDIHPQTEKQLKKVMSYHQDQEIFAQNFLNYHIAELKRGIMNIRLDLKQFEKNYQISTKKFYDEFENGERHDNKDYIIWAGLYEMYCENKLQLKEFL